MPSPDDLMTIGVFARATGITQSALRFYADSGVLAPACVDEATGYRYYSQAQLDRAVTIRRLREIDMPLDRVVEVLGAGPDRAAALIDEHVDGLALRVGQARDTAATVRAALGRPGGSIPVAAVRGPVFAAAVEQVLAATAHGREHPALTGIHIEASDGSLDLTATDRYRLSTRTVALDRPGAGWVGTVDGDDLRLALAWVRRRPIVELRGDAHRLVVDGGDAGTRACRLLPEPFPDHRAVFAALAPARTRVIVARNALVQAVSGLDDRAVLDVADGELLVSAPGSTPVHMSASVQGDAVTVTFEVTTLYPAITTTAGPDVMLDIAAPDQPVVVRSADDGDLTTLAMPVRNEGEPE